jgi:hypothetical protein
VDQYVLICRTMQDNTPAHWAMTVKRFLANSGGRSTTRLIHLTSRQSILVFHKAKISLQGRKKTSQHRGHQQERNCRIKWSSLGHLQCLFMCNFLKCVNKRSHRRLPFTCWPCTSHARVTPCQLHARNPPPSSSLISW